MPATIPGTAHAKGRRDAARASIPRCGRDGLRRGRMDCERLRPSELDTRSFELEPFQRLLEHVSLLLRKIAVHLNQNVPSGEHVGEQQGALLS